MTAALWWIRRDLRLTDNQALTAARAHADRVVPVFVLDPKLWASSYVGDKRLAFLLGGLHQLDADLRARGSRLVVCQGDPRNELSGLATENSAEAIFAEEDFSTYAGGRHYHFRRSLTCFLHRIDWLGRRRCAACLYRQSQLCPLPCPSRPARRKLSAAYGLLSTETHRPSTLMAGCGIAST
jgi:deoxyribodipyrimidine photo-lyase